MINPKEKFPLKGLNQDQINDYFKNENWHESRDRFSDAFNYYLSNKKANQRVAIISKYKYDHVLHHELLVKIQATLKIQIPN